MIVSARLGRTVLGFAFVMRPCEAGWLYKFMATMVFPVYCVAMPGCGCRERATELSRSRMESHRTESGEAGGISAGKPEPLRKEGDATASRDMSKISAESLKEKSLEELLFSFRCGDCLGITPDPRLMPLEWGNRAAEIAAVDANAMIMEELRRRDRNRIPKEILMKHRDLHASVFTGHSGPYVTVAEVCRTLLGEYGSDVELPTF